MVEPKLVDSNDLMSRVSGRYAHFKNKAGDIPAGIQSRHRDKRDVSVCKGRGSTGCLFKAKDICGQGHTSCPGGMGGGTS